MKDVNAAINFIWKYTDAMILGACLKIFQKTRSVDEPKLDDVVSCLPAQEKTDLQLSEVINELILREDICDTFKLYVLALK